MNMHATTRRRVAAAAALATLAVPATTAAHTTISPSQPGPLLTSARTSYIVRAPNEKPRQATWKIVMYVPATIQTAISVRNSTDWKVRLHRVPTGQKDGEGNDLYAIRSISWTATSPGAEILPSEYGEWGVRFQNPAFATKLCFGFSQYYRNPDGSRRRPEIVKWTGSAGSEHPSSCVQVVNQ